MKRKHLNIAGWVLVLVGLGALLGFVEVAQGNLAVVEHQIRVGDQHAFIDKEDVRGTLLNKGFDLKKDTFSHQEIAEMEQILERVPWISAVEVFRSIDGRVEIEAVQRNPILRVISRSGEQAYIDDSGKLMPLSHKYSAKVPVFTGKIGKLTNVNGLSTTEGENPVLQGLFDFAQIIGKDEFWKSQLVQVYVNSKQELELIPRVGNHRVLFGTSEGASEKLRKLKLLYQDGWDSKDWNLYDTVNLKYRDQIVCSKR